ncbi:hypothetical protein HMF8227_02861 [Saliniradius amylolyticus]|uniref:Motility protein n=1 Tax=Saliniradius amylolyticus TaxID=2183582 RepID=A0A2S2E7Y2_9ALTE|nr:hypothetical protein [Saliniradius amylolyticus]AWL13310.1 hypothetical protein HMF8227_02861 [Saliniradius amylolyticus]
MQIQSPTTGMASADFSSEVRSAKLAKDMQEQEGQQALQLLEAAAVQPAPSSANASIGGNIDTFA